MLRISTGLARLSKARGYSTAVSPAKILVGLNVRADRFAGDQTALLQELAVNSDLGEEHTDAILSRFEERTKANAAYPVDGKAAEGHARQWIALLDDLQTKCTSTEKFQGQETLDLQMFREALDLYRQEDSLAGFFQNVSLHRVDPISLLDPTAESTYERVITGKDGKRAIYVPTDAQLAEAEALKNVAIPEKVDGEFETHLINMMMKHGRKNAARRHFYQACELAQVMVKADPIPLLKEIFDDVAPVCVIKSTPVGARKVQYPVPITERQRRRIVWKWSVENAEKRPNRSFSVRLGEEIASVIKSKGSSLKEKTLVIHNNAVANRVHVDPTRSRK